MSRPLTLNGPTSTRDLIRLRIGPVTGLQSRDFAPGTSNSRSIVRSSAEDRPWLKEDVGGIGITSAGDGDAPEKITLDKCTDRATGAVAPAALLATFFTARLVAFFAALLAMATSLDQPSTKLRPIRVARELGKALGPATRRRAASFERLSERCSASKSERRPLSRGQCILAPPDLTGRLARVG